jgi:hypothetical protein
MPEAPSKRRRLIWFIFLFPPTLFRDCRTRRTPSRNRRKFDALYRIGIELLAVYSNGGKRFLERYDRPLSDRKSLQYRRTSGPVYAINPPPAVAFGSVWQVADQAGSNRAASADPSHSRTRTT